MTGFGRATLAVRALADSANPVSDLNGQGRSGSAMIKRHYIERDFAYDGSQLHSLFAYLKHGVQGDSIVSWVGPCKVETDHMVDGEDLLAGASIAGSRMVHFIVEKFGASLPEMVWMQRLLASLVCDFLSASGKYHCRRDGDDVFVKLPKGEGKASISIATVSPVSGLIHFAVNVSNRGTPVETASLEDFQIPERDFAISILQAFTAEFDSVSEATRKVRWVK